MAARGKGFWAGFAWGAIGVPIILTAVSGIGLAIASRFRGSKQTVYSANSSSG